MQQAEDWPVAELLPHDGNMVLLDDVLESRPGGITVQLTVRADGLFDKEGAVPATLGIEYMAQAIAAYAGGLAKQNGEPVKLGFLLGTRKYQSSCPVIQCGTLLRISVDEVLAGDNGLSVFDCEISGEGVSITANVNVFQPADAEKFLQEGQL